MREQLSTLLILSTLIMLKFCMPKAVLTEKERQGLVDLINSILRTVNEEFYM